MKKTVKLLFIWIITLFLCVNIDAQTDWEHLNLKGKVKTVNVYIYSALIRNGKILDRDSVKKISAIDEIKYTYNKKGFLKELILYNADGLVEYKTIMLYNKNNQLIEKRVNHMDTIDSGRLIYIYNDTGNLIEENSYNFKDSLEFKDVYNYDKNGYKSEKNRFYSGKISKSESFKNDEKGNIIQYSVGGRYGGGKQYYYKYDEKGRISEEECLDPVLNFIELTLFYKYNDMGNQSEIICLESDSTLRSRQTLDYDMYGNLTKKCSYAYGNERPFIMDYKYEYDIKGNWIKKIHFQNDKIQFVKEREIKYY